MDIKRKKTSLPRHILHNSNSFYPHTNLSTISLALDRTSVDQRFVLVAIAVGIITALILAPRLSISIFIGLISAYYLIDLLFNAYLSIQSWVKSPEIDISVDRLSAERESWPAYTILCPLYKEQLILPQFTKAMSSLDYPRDQLQVLIILEAEDVDTIAVAKSMDLDRIFQIIVVPDTKPKTKPKACNYAMSFAKGKYTVIYDAEDVPDTNQLKKAVLAFEQSVPDIVCLQAKLNYYNAKHNLLTKAFTAEYSTWFGLTLPGLQYVSAPIPLGGTSNHFITSALRTLSGWDPFNVTEDADLGLRLSSSGMRTAILDSTTLEEANSVYSGWLKQRSRWIKGYMQTYFVHMRYRNLRASTNSIWDHFLFQIIVGGKVVMLFINPVMWLLTVAYFVLRPEIGPTIQQLFIGPVFYAAIFTLVIGNFLYAYNMILGLAKQGHEDLIVYMIFIPLYWLMMSIAAVYALYELILRPHYWQKTQHGLQMFDGGPS
jgi:cellulose synthase/poly-beta-1,6-N-acetylglucosamine synthase-like glycosyltransferase